MLKGLRKEQLVYCGGKWKWTAYGHIRNNIVNQMKMVGDIPGRHGINKRIWVGINKNRYETMEKGSRYICLERYVLLTKLFF